MLFRPSDSQDEPEIKGSIGWISTAADDQTRTVKVRVESAESPTAGCGPTRSAPAGSCCARNRRRSSCPARRSIGTAAATSSSCATRTSSSEGAPKFFHIRKVRLGVKDGDTTEIIAGLLPGEVIASKNSVVLEAQLLKSNLGPAAAAATATKQGRH